MLESRFPFASGPGLPDQAGQQSFPATRLAGRRNSAYKWVQSPITPGGACPDRFRRGEACPDHFQPWEACHDRFQPGNLCRHLHIRPLWRILPSSHRMGHPRHGRRGNAADRPGRHAHPVAGGQRGRRGGSHRPRRRSDGTYRPLHSGGRSRLSLLRS